MRGGGGQARRKVILRKNAGNGWTEEVGLHRLLSLWRARCAVALSVRYLTGGSEERRFLVDADARESHITGEEHSEAPEGLLVDSGTSEVKWITVLAQDGRDASEDSSVTVKSVTHWDAVIVHMGWLEREIAAKMIKSQPNFLESLAKFTGRLIITSGRGKLPSLPALKHQAGVLPFLEYAAVGPYVVNELSKHSLGMGLLGVSGSEDEG